jgi:NRPS condensation-like uncharacterized protein
VTATSRPFGIADQLNCYFDSPAEPTIVHLEAWLPGHLDIERLRGAVALVLAAEPAARAHRDRTRRWGRSYTWTVPPRTDRDPLTITTWHVEPELDAARAAFLSSAPPIDHSPPFRLLLARGPGRDSLILNANHAAFDGRSCLVLLSMIAAEYNGESTPRATPAQPQPAPAPPEPAPPQPAPPQLAARNRGRALPRRAARITAQRTSRRAAGYGFCLLPWTGVPALPWGDDEGRPRATVNDLLVAALIGTIGQWNDGHGRRARTIRISIPLDARPPGHGNELGNHSVLSSVTTTDASATEGLLAVVAAQTSQAKQRPPAREVNGGLTALARLPLPSWVKRGLLRLAIRSLGVLIADTSLLSNLGNVTDPPRFGPLVASPIWFSTSAHMPRGLSVGAITTGGQLHVCFRYRYALLDDAAAAAFAASYAQTLSSMEASQTRASQVRADQTRASR